MQLDAGAFTYRLSESTEELALWTTPSARRIAPVDRGPDEQRSGLTLSAARGEFEPVQVILEPGAGELRISSEGFASLGSAARFDLAVAEFEDGLSERLRPVDWETSIAASRSEPTVVWMTVYVPEDAPAGQHETTVEVTRGDTTVSVPLELYVFDFSIADARHFATQINIDVGGLVPEGGEVEDAKTLLFEHRLTPKSVTWPSGFGWNITWDNDSSPDRCGTFWDEPDEGDDYSIGALSRKYLLGEDWNGQGFPTAMLFQFVDNSTPRPASFCRIDRGDHYGSAAYNAEWSEWLGELEGYLDEQGMLERSYYYVQNEPQNDEDHQLAAHLCRLTRAAAPNLRIAISEEPKPEIAEDAEGACGYDIWIAHVRAYQEDYAWERQREHHEAVWFYSLDQDPDPYFNPTGAESQGMHARIIPWAAWAHRITGWAYYDGGRFIHDGIPGVRAALLREGQEDYEYLVLANGGQPPGVDETAVADATAQSVATSMTSWTRDPDALMALRHELGLYIEGSRSELPLLPAAEPVRARGSYYLNFQDPAGEPTVDPLIVDGNEWLKIGWSAYDEDLGYGWYGENVGDSGIALHGYDDVDGASETARSYVYDDYGRDNLFEFAVENGVYEVTAVVGRPARAYPGDPYNLVIEGVRAINDIASSEAEPQIPVTVEVEITDGALSLEVGGRSESTGDWAYTFLASASIVPVE